MKAVVLQTTGGERVDIGRRDFRAVAMEIGEAGVIQNDIDNIRATGPRLNDRERVRLRVCGVLPTTPPNPLDGVAGVEAFWPLAICSGGTEQSGAHQLPA